MKIKLLNLWWMEKYKNTLMTSQKEIQVSEDFEVQTYGRDTSTI